ncbi:MAG: hypothetical protein L3J18_05905 [Candidatus Brocadia sp.]|nr:MAG: hypothetical protein L3J18_05905 [Candidatus Brocadia sp.]
MPTGSCKLLGRGAGLPLPQLRDVHTHVVTLSGGISTVVYNGVGDCLVPVVFVLGNL